MSERKKGSTSVSLLFRLTDSTTGAAKSGIDVTTLKLQYERPGEAASTATSLTALAALTTAFTAYGAKEVDATNSKGVYRVDCPDAGFATGADEVTFTVTGTGIEPSTRLIDLTAFDSRDGVRGALTSLPNVASGSAGAIPTTGTGANQISLSSGQVILQAGTGTGQLDFTSGVLKGNVVQLLGTAWLTPTVAGTPDVNVKLYAGQTAAVGADNLPKVGVWGFLGTLLTETIGGNITAAFKKAFDVAASVWTAASVNQTGDSFNRIGANGSGLTSLAPSATALSNAVWTNARAGYLDNANVGGALASHADIAAINQSASKHLLLQTVGQYEPGETYTIEMRTYAAADGSAVNADVTPTLTATGTVSGSLSANLSAATNPATGVYRWTYTPGASPTLEQIRFDGSATISAATFTLSCYSQTVDFATAVFTATDQSHLTSIFNKLPTNNIADETLLLNAIGSPQQVGTKYAVTISAADVTGNLPANAVQIGGAAPGSAVIGTVTNVTNPVTAGTVTDKSGYALAVAPPTAAQVATAVWTDTTASDFTTSGSPGKILATQLGGAFTNASSSVFTALALANAPTGGGSGTDPLTNASTSYVAGEIGYEIHWLYQRGNADEVIDTTSSPGWNIVYYVQGSTTELLRQRLLDISGSPVKLATTIVAQTKK